MSTFYPDIDRIHEEVEQIINDVRELESDFWPQIDLINSNFRKSAINLIHYLALRKVDLSSLQEGLRALGVSRLGQVEKHVMANLIRLDHTLSLIRNKKPVVDEPLDFISYEEGAELLNGHTLSLLGNPQEERRARIMVTIPTEVAWNRDFAVQLISSGMDVARINCAHDDQAVWEKMIRNIREAEKQCNRKVTVFIDLAGPKLRTGPITRRRQSFKLSPKKDRKQQGKIPIKVLLSSEFGESRQGDVIKLPFLPEKNARLNTGDILHFMDVRGKFRKLVVDNEGEEGYVAFLDRKTFVQENLEIFRGEKNEKVGRIGELPWKEQSIFLFAGDLLELSKFEAEGGPAEYDSSGRLFRLARISCPSEVIYTHVKVGERVLIDDGKIGGIVEKVNDEHLLIRITLAKTNGSRLRSDKGINFPDSHLRLNGLTEKDKKDLAFIIEHADVVNMSFVNGPQDVYDLQTTLKNLGKTDFPICLKIETMDGFRHLPAILLTAMRSPIVGVMIARGDLAVECGWNRLAEIQEEILLLCEAAHIPDIWATQVLERLAQKGQPSRAEITDAAMSQRAECVMLNKGPHILEAIDMLNEILCSMRPHARKKTSVLPSLKGLMQISI
ncbi:pyruvate kinase [Xanthovirga aplysinae]|uniref:pyruvate kinase n=1 Tax=Xanthovirga aplysinae TaxID=2529853 RepID=UPI0012BC37E8|nr:pyruvate kinase [Xanthovirga aplysinae]MTI31319.1 hypothetical protein [Xanthovirga aplysinae]